MSATYFWYQDQVVVLGRKVIAEDFQQAAMHKYRYCLCVDTFEPVHSHARYGFWEQNDSNRFWPTIWKWQPLKDFPAEFRAHLLLLGVS